MIKIYDVECKNCGNIEEVFCEEIPNCPICGRKRRRIFTTMNFKLIYNNKKDICGWNDSGYASSQYWSRVKQAEDKTGKRHKSVYED